MQSEETTPKFFIEPLSKHHDRAAFSCAVPVLNEYLQRQATQDVKKRVAVVFMLTSDGRTIAGFYTLSHYAIELDVLPEVVAKKLPKYPRIPATLLGRLAVSGEFRGRKMGERLLMDALRRTLDGSKALASAAVVVDAKNAAAVAFYKKYGFLELPTIADRLFLPMATIEKLFG